MADVKRQTVFLVGENSDGSFVIMEAQGIQLLPPNEDQWSVVTGCFLQTVPAKKVYATREIANARVEELRKEKVDVREEGHPIDEL